MTSKNSVAIFVNLCLVPDFYICAPITCIAFCISKLDSTFYVAARIDLQMVLEAILMAGNCARNNGVYVEPNLK